MSLYRIIFSYSIVRSVWFLCLLSTCSASCADDTEYSDSIPANSSIERLLEEVASSEGLPGGIIAAVSDANGLITLESAGLRKLKNSIEITTSDQIHLGSCTKAMTSTLLAILVQENLISWDTRFIDVFPELADTVHQSYHDVTLHQLVTHRGAIPENAESWWVFPDLEIKERRRALIIEALQVDHHLPKGEFKYSNLGYVIAGSMAERVTGIAWEDLIQERLFQPLKMYTAGFGSPGTTGLVDQPWGHKQVKGIWNPFQADNPEAIGPAGTVHCSVEDWVKFLSLQLPNNNSKILSSNQRDFLIEPIGEYAAGWRVVKRSWADGITLTHSGSNTFWYVTVWVAPEIDRIFTVAMNSADQKSVAIADRIIGELIKWDQSEQ